MTSNLQRLRVNKRYQTAISSEVSIALTDVIETKELSGLSRGTRLLTFYRTGGSRPRPCLASELRAAPHLVWATRLTILPWAVTVFSHSIAICLSYNRPLLPLPAPSGAEFLLVTVQSSAV